uniref:Uncharacterized protein n=1 Tax=Cyprinodon variegatus TaxID=28743 RepID=A0A3Q2E6Q4_CYPVA
MPLFFRKRKPSEDSQKRLEHQLYWVRTGPGSGLCGVRRELCSNITDKSPDLVLAPPTLWSMRQSRLHALRQQQLSMERSIESFLLLLFNKSKF